MWVTKLLISPVKKGFFAQKRPNLAQNWHFWSILARPCRLIWCPVGGSFGDCGAGCISQDTYLLYDNFDTSMKKYQDIGETNLRQIRHNFDTALTKL